MATATETYAPRLKTLYEQELRPQLKDELELSSMMQVPRVTKITLNMGVGEAKTDAKQLDAALEELTTIAGQRAQVRRARKSIAQFKVREGMAVGARGSESTRRSRITARPMAVPTHRLRSESSKRVLTSFDGKPSAVEYLCQPSGDFTLAPFGVANQTRPSAASSTASTVLEASPSAVV